MGFLGKGWAFPITTAAPTMPGAPTPIAMSADDVKIQQSIQIILTTTPGERVMRSDFGCGLNLMVFADQSQSTIGDAVSEVKLALARWEPRINVLSVDAVSTVDEPNLLLINVEYLVLATNSRFNLVYPFYLS
jgi:hypothetical protein